jgi:hypothetical protein
MSEVLLIPARLINGIITIAFFPLLYRIFKRTHRRFYQLWGAGFLLYGVSVVLRASFPLIDLENSISAQLFSYVFILAGFILIITGIGDIVNKAKLMFVASMSLPLLLVALYFTSQPYDIGRAISLSPYVFVSVSLLIFRRWHTPALDLLTVGWGILLVDNIALALGMMNEIFVEIFAIFGKVVILVGMTYPRFSLLADDLRRFLISGLPTEYPENDKHRFTLLDSTSGERDDEIKWIKNKVNENSIRATRTILVTMYDLIAPPDLARGGVDENELYLVRMLVGGRGPINVFEEHTMTINDDMYELDVLFTEIISFSNDRKINCDIILYTLSSMVHTHGWKRVYSFLISKVQQIKESKVHVYAFYYPNTHEDRAEIAKFEKLFDNVMKI